MGDTLWGERGPGDEAAIGVDETGADVVIYGEPDRIRTPPDLGSQEFRVAAVYRDTCPCRSGHEVNTYALVGTDLHVSECGAHGFLWWKRRESHHRLFKVLGRDLPTWKPR